MRLLVVVIDVVDAVSESEAGKFGELLGAAGGAEEFEAEDVAELHGGGAYASGGGVDEDARARFFAGRGGLDRLLEQAGLPVEQPGGEVVDGEGGALGGGPAFGLGPVVAFGDGDVFGAGRVLGVAHDAAAVFGDAGELASHDVGRGGAGGIAAEGAEDVGKVDADGFDLHQDFMRGGGGYGNVAECESGGALGRGHDDGFHVEDCRGRRAATPPLNYSNCKSRFGEKKNRRGFSPENCLRRSPCLPGCRENLAAHLPLAGRLPW